MEEIGELDRDARDIMAWSVEKIKQEEKKKQEKKGKKEKKNGRVFGRNL